MGVCSTGQRAGDVTKTPAEAGVSRTFQGYSEIKNGASLHRRSQASEDDFRNASPTMHAGQERASAADCHRSNSQGDN